MSQRGDEQRMLAASLREEIYELVCDDEPITTMLLLDALGCAGLKLVLLDGPEETLMIEAMFGLAHSQ